MLDERQRVDRAAQNTRAATRPDGGWDAIAEELDGEEDKPRLEGLWEKARVHLGHLHHTKPTRFIAKRIC
jgi:peptide methionine sulfoxide reductase MsrB